MTVVINSDGVVLALIVHTTRGGEGVLKRVLNRHEVTTLGRDQKNGRLDIRVSNISRDGN